MAALIFVLCLLLSTSAAIATDNGEQISLKSGNMRLSVVDVTDESATLKWVFPAKEVTQKGFKIKCTGNPLNTGTAAVYDDPDEFEGLINNDAEDVPTDLSGRNHVKVLYAFENARSITVDELKPGYEYSCSVLVGRKKEGKRPWRKLIRPITFKTLTAKPVSTVSTTTVSPEPEGKLAAALNFSKNYRKLLALIILGGALPILLLFGCLGVCILYCKCKTARMKNQRYAAFTRSIQNQKKATEIAELGLSPGMIDHRTPPWMTGQEMFKKYAQEQQQQQSQAQPNARSSRWAQSKRFKAPITSIRLNENESQKYIGSTNEHTMQNSSFSDSDSDGDNRKNSAKKLKIPDHIQTLYLSSNAFGINCTKTDQPTTLLRSQSTTLSTNKPTPWNARKTRTRRTPTSRPMLTSESSSETSGVPLKQPLSKGSRSLTSMRGTKSKYKMPPPKPIPRRPNSTQLTLLDILASIPLPPEEDGY